jgi:hypothetical protein
MSFSIVLFKKRLEFFLLVMFIFLGFSHQGFAMLRAADTQPEDQPPQKKRRLEEPTNDPRTLERQSLEQYTLGGIYKGGIDVEEATHRYFQLTADQGEIDAQYYLGVMYKDGRGVGKDEKEAYWYYKLAADQGHARAQWYLGDMYVTGKGVEKDEKEACRYYKLAADQGHAIAQSNLGMMYRDGRGVGKDEKEACRYYKLAADQGHARPQWFLGCMYATGRGVEKDEKEACRYFHLAADQGLAGAQYWLGDMYVTGRGVEKDEKEAFRYYKLAADQGHADTQCYLGTMYVSGRGVEKDEKEACRYFHLAADQGHGDAQWFLGGMYATGRGVEKNEKAACRYYQLAADQGHAYAQGALGEMYEGGRGVVKNRLEALHWYIKSKHQDAAPFVRTALPITQNAPVEGDSFQEMLVHIMQGDNLALNEEGGLSRLIRIHQTKIGVNTKSGYRESKLGIPELADMYKPIEDWETNAINMMGLLTTTTPGFMVTRVSLSRDIKSELPQQLTPFFSFDTLDDVDYLTIGEENVRVVNRFVTFLKESGKNFAKADNALKKIGKLYQQGLDAVFSELLIKQQLARMYNGNADHIKAFEEQEKKFNKLKPGLTLIIEEIKEERALLSELHNKIKSLPFRGMGSRNKDFLEEYSALLLP